MLEFKRTCFTEVHAFLELVAEQYATKIGGEKGNVTLTSYDGTLRVTVAVGNCISFGPEIQSAKTIIDECLKEWTKGGNPNLEAIVMDAFDVGQQGKLQAGKILGLRRLNIEDERWLRAMNAISDSVRLDVTKDYVRLHRRGNVEGKWELVPFDMAKL